MAKRLQVILQDPEYREIQKMARSRRMSLAEWVRQALDVARRREPLGSAGKKLEVIRAAAQTAAEGTAKITLLGRPSAIESAAKEMGLGLSSVAIVDPAQSNRLDAYARIYHERRRSRGIRLDEALVRGIDADFGHVRAREQRAQRPQRQGERGRVVLSARRLEAHTPT